MTEKSIVELELYNGNDWNGRNHKLVLNAEFKYRKPRARFIRELKVLLNKYDTE